MCQLKTHIYFTICLYITIVFDVDKIFLFHTNNKIAQFTLTLVGCRSVIELFMTSMSNYKFGFIMHAFGVGNAIKV